MSDSTVSISERITALATEFFEVTKPISDALVALADEVSTPDELRHLANTARRLGYAYTGSPSFIENAQGERVMAFANGAPKMSGGIQQVCWAKGADRVGLGRSSNRTVATVSVAPAPALVVEGDPF